MAKKRLLRMAFVVVVVCAAAYGFWWWRVQEMDAERCGAAIAGLGAAETGPSVWRYYRAGEGTPWDERKYREEGVSLADIIMHEYVDRYCEGRSGVLLP